MKRACAGKFSAILIRWQLQCLVAQISNLLVPGVHRLAQVVLQRLQAGSPAVQQIGNLRYGSGMPGRVDGEEAILVMAIGVGEACRLQILQLSG